MKKKLISIALILTSIVTLVSVAGGAARADVDARLRSALLAYVDFLSQPQALRNITRQSWLEDGADDWVWGERIFELYASANNIRHLEFIDFDNDGIPEMIVRLDVGDFGLHENVLLIVRYAGGGNTEIIFQHATWDSPRYASFSSVSLAECPAGQIYLMQGGFECDAPGSHSSYYTLVNGRWVEVFSWRVACIWRRDSDGYFTRSHTALYINGREVSESYFQDAVDNYDFVRINSWWQGETTAAVFKNQIAVMLLPFLYYSADFNVNSYDEEEETLEEILYVTELGVLTADEVTILRDGAFFEMTTFQVDGSMFVPIGRFSEALGIQINHDAASGFITVGPAAAEASPAEIIEPAAALEDTAALENVEIINVGQIIGEIYEEDISGAILPIMLAVFGAVIIIGVVFMFLKRKKSQNNEYTPLPTDNANQRQETFCLNCGAEIKQGCKFCGGCGKVV